MKIQYYSGYFDGPLPEQMAELLRDDITNKSSLAIVWGSWAIDEYFGIVKDIWLEPAGIAFNEYHLIDSRMPKEKAHESLRNASAILMMAGNTVPQHDFLTEYELSDPIEQSKAAVVMGFSAGAKNMGLKWVCSKSDGYEVEKTDIYDGLGLGNFCYVPYFSPDNEDLIKNDLLPLSQNLDIYATANESFIRVENGRVTALGDTYLISNSKIRML